MSRHDSRRSVLQACSVVGMGSLSGCLFDLYDDPSAGSIVINNRSDQPHSVTVEISKTSEDSDDVRLGERLGSETSLLEERTYEYEVSADGWYVAHGRHVEENVITEPGAYYITADSDRGGEDFVWLGLYRSGRGGVAENYAAITIYEDGTVTAYGTHGD